jgi:glycosyltransferase involved in cell wall biosynthesis
MGAAPELSVVLATRDAAVSLPACIESVLTQEGVDLELVIVDDGSTDGSAELLSAWSRRDTRCRVLRQPAAGLTAALRAGCEIAAAPLVARQDARDESLQGRLRRQRDAFMTNPEVALVSCFTECLAPGGEFLRVERGDATPDVAVPLFSDDGFRHVGPTSHGSTMFRRADFLAVGGYRLEFALGQDWDLWLRLGERGRYLTVGEVLYRRTLSAESTSFASRGLQMAFGEASTAASRLRRAGHDEAPALARARALSESWAAMPRRASRRDRALALYHFGEQLRRNGDPASRRYLWRAAATDPLLLRAWVRLMQPAPRADHGPRTDPGAGR